MSIDNSAGPGGVSASYGRRTTISARKYNTASVYGDTFREVGDGPLSDHASATSLAPAILAYKDGLRTRPPVMFGIGDPNFAGNGAGLGTGTVRALAPR